MKYYSFAIFMLLQSASLVSAKHNLIHKSHKTLDEQILDFENLAKKHEKNHKHHHTASLA